MFQHQCHGFHCLLWEEDRAFLEWLRQFSCLKRGKKEQKGNIATWRDACLWALFILAAWEILLHVIAQTHIFLNEGYCHWFQRAKGPIIIFFALHLASLLIDWTACTTFYLKCLPKQFWGQIFYFMATMTKMCLPSSCIFQIFILKFISKRRNLGIAHLGDTHSHIYTYCPSYAGLRRLKPISETVCIIN